MVCQHIKTPEIEGIISAQLQRAALFNRFGLHLKGAILVFWPLKAFFQHMLTLTQSHNIHTLMVEAATQGANLLIRI